MRMEKRPHGSPSGPRSRLSDPRRRLITAAADLAELQRAASALAPRLAAAEQATAALPAAEVALRAFLFELEVAGGDGDQAERRRLVAAVRDARAAAEPLLALQVEHAELQAKIGQAADTQRACELDVVREVAIETAARYRDVALDALRLETGVRALAQWCFAKGFGAAGEATMASLRAIPFATDADPGAADRAVAELNGRREAHAVGWSEFLQALDRDPTALPPAV